MAALPLSHVCSPLLVLRTWHQEGFPMKMNGQSRTFVKQVKLDLLALSDADLFYTLQQWVDGGNLPGIALDVPEDTRLALGYTHVPAETEPLPYLGINVPEAESEGPASWLAPSPHLLRNLLSAMNEELFVQHVITLAFQSLHPIYPEWHEGLTFNAHLANYLRQLNKRRSTMTTKQNSSR
jgi:hypothetical protein